MPSTPVLDSSSAGMLAAKKPLWKKALVGLGVFCLAAGVSAVVVWQVLVNGQKNTGFMGYARMSFEPASSRRRLLGGEPVRLRTTTVQTKAERRSLSSLASWGTYQTSSNNGDTVLFWSSSNASTLPGLVRQDTPSKLEGIIVYAYVSEASNSSATSVCLGNSKRFQFCPPSGDCCMNTIIYENPGCCRNGATPSLESMKDNQCTFDAFYGGQCQSDCDLDPSNSDVRSGCQNWYSTPGGPKASTYIDFAKSSTVVNQELGSVVLPFLRDTFEPWVSAGGKYRSVSIQWGKNHVGNVKNWRFKGPGMNATQAFQWGITSYSQFGSSQTLSVSRGDSVRFSMDYDLTGMIYVLNFTGASGLGFSPSSATNCHRNTTTGLYHCLDIWRLSQAFTPKATIAPSLTSLYA